MAFVDKMKEEASHLAEKAEEASKVVRAKFEAAQAKRKAQGVFVQLGRLKYADATGRSTPDDEAKARDLVAELQKYEAEHGPIDSDSASDSAA